MMGKNEGKNYLQDPGADGRIMLKWILGGMEGRGLD
jgi:hypothetical protein